MLLIARERVRERSCRQVEREEEEDEAVGWETDGEACGGGATRAV